MSEPDPDPAPVTSDPTGHYGPGYADPTKVLDKPPVTTSDASDSGAGTEGRSGDGADGVPVPPPVPSPS